mgnify:CR=1 FL=1|jgi:rhodanese-related sulfurtransferase
MKLKKGFMELVAEAEQEINSLDINQVEAKLQAEEGSGLLLVDLRDVREVKREGRIPGSLHIPRGMLEFWIDPDSPYYRKEFDEAEEIILYCNKGWRSALAAQTLQVMGVENVSHMTGGMELWRQEIGRIEEN